MKTKQNFTIVLAVLLSIALISTAAWAKRDIPPAPLLCGLTGTWMGDAENDLTWMGIHTSTDGIRGEMLMNWVRNDLFQDTNMEMAPGHGVWELINSDTGTYIYTWFSQVKITDPNGENPPQILPIRVYGTAEMQDCDNVIIYYDFEIQVDQDQDGTAEWVLFDKGTASETRFKVYTPEIQ